MTPRLRTLAPPSFGRDHARVDAGSRERVGGWSAFVVWAIAGAMWAFSVISFAAGPFMIPFAGWLTWIAWRRTERRRDVLGLVAGVGAFILFVGFLHVGDVPCDSPRAPRRSSCGGIDAKPWLIVGSVIVAAGILPFLRPREKERADAS